MLSNPSPNLQNRQRQHRRQNSTPTAFDAVKVPLLPQFQRQNSHRRGMSLDQRPRPRQLSPQETNSNTNPGFQQQQLQQHILREAQQQRLARPGLRTSLHSDFSEDESYLSSPLGTPGRQSFDTEYSNYGDSSQILHPSYDFYTGPINQIIKVNPNNRLSLGGSNDLSYDNSTLSPSTYLANFSFDDASSQQSQFNYGTPHRRRISGGIANRVSKFEGLGGEGISRPVTPPNQYASGYFPPTPAETPYRRVKAKHGTPQAPQQFLDPIDTSMEETLKPNKRRSAMCNVDVFQEMRREAEANGMPSPPSTAPLPASSMFDTAPMPAPSYMDNKNVNYLKIEAGYESSNYSPTSASFSPRHMSQQPSPGYPQASHFSDPFENKPTLDLPSGSNPYLRTESRGLRIDHSVSPTRGSMQRSDSLSSVNLEESITDTGITIDDIATFIEGPGADNKWLCLYPECKKRFGRKENVKSHVQTHLGDRQYQCAHCHKCFVRQHDLKRHAKIHTGVKPYPCLCGNSFARHDALTRHRQRGMCIGAFEGVVKKVVKRGRPKKARPDIDERQEKSSRTRIRNKATSSASSSYSESNFGGHSPPASFEAFDTARFGTPIRSSGNVNQSSPTRSSHSSPTVECVSPQVIHSAPSPSHSYHSNHSHHQSHHGSPVNTPPGLSQSSSSPTPGTAYFDLEGASEGASESDHDHNAEDIEEDSSSAQEKRFQDVHGNDDIFVNSFGGGINGDEDMMMMSKFADAFGTTGNTNEMFGTLEQDDVFFGNP